jgi:hypothetical protein
LPSRPATRLASFFRTPRLRRRPKNSSCCDLFAMHGVCPQTSAPRRAGGDSGDDGGAFSNPAHKPR